MCCEITTLTMIPFLKSGKPSVARLYIMILGLTNMVINQVIQHRLESLRNNIESRALLTLVKITVVMNVINFVNEEFSSGSNNPPDKLEALYITPQSKD